MGDSDLQVQAAHWPRKIGLSFCCKACSGVKAIPFPIPISELSEAADEFVEKHAMCKIAREDVVVMYDESKPVPPEAGPGGEEDQQGDQPVHEGAPAGDADDVGEDTVQPPTAEGEGIQP